MLLSMLCLGLVAASPLAQSPAREPISYPELAVTLDLSMIEQLVPSEKPPASDSLRGEWMGRLGESELRVRFTTLNSAEYGLVEPEDVVEVWRETLRDARGEGKDLAFTFDAVRSFAAEVGCAPIVATTRASIAPRDGSHARGQLFLCGGLLPEWGWSLRVDVWPAPTPEVADAFATALRTSVKYAGKPCDPKWTDAQATALWERLAPPEARKKPMKAVRTEHYLVLTNAPSPNTFVKKLEGYHAAIAKALPVEALPGRRLLPIVLYRSRNEYEIFHRAHHKADAQAPVNELSFCDFGWVATSTDAGDEHSLLLDLGKQFVLVRLRAWGSNRWLRSGLRECVASKPKDRVDALRAIRKGKYTPLAKLMEDAAWDAELAKQGQKGTTGEASYWEQAALWIEFLRDGPWPAQTFTRFLASVGGLAKGDQAGVEAALRAVYGMELDALQAKWVEHYSKP